MRGGIDALQPKAAPVILIWVGAFVTFTADLKIASDIFFSQTYTRRIPTFAERAVFKIFRRDDQLAVLHGNLLGRKKTAPFGANIHVAPIIIVQGVAVEFVIKIQVVPCQIQPCRFNYNGLCRFRCRRWVSGLLSAGKQARKERHDRHKERSDFCPNCFHNGFFLSLSQLYLNYSTGSSTNNSMYRWNMEKPAASDYTIKLRMLQGLSVIK